MDFQDEAIRRLHQELRAPFCETDQLWCWNLCPGVEVIVQKNQRNLPLTLWMPDPGDALRPPFARQYLNRTERPSGSRHVCAPSLAIGNPVVGIEIQSPAVLDETIRCVQGLCRSRARQGAKGAC